MFLPNRINNNRGKLRVFTLGQGYNITCFIYYLKVAMGASCMYGLKHSSDNPITGPSPPPPSHSIW